MTVDAAKDLHAGCASLPGDSPAYWNFGTYWRMLARSDNTQGRSTTSDELFPEGVVGWGGRFTIRFPAEGEPGDDGWHIEGSYAGPDGSWWTNHWSKDRALLMLVLFSDVGEHDAPTRIRVDSHRFIRGVLLPHGVQGAKSHELVLPDEVHACPLAHTIGRAGDVFLCHPLLVPAAQTHRGDEPRFIARPGVPWKDGERLSAGDCL